MGAQPISSLVDGGRLREKDPVTEVNHELGKFYRLFY